MSLDNPLSMFDVKGKVALITGASGAFGAVAARCLSGAGCKVVLAAGNADAMAEVAAIRKMKSQLLVCGAAIMTVCLALGTDPATRQPKSLKTSRPNVRANQEFSNWYIDSPSSIATDRRRWNYLYHAQS